MYADEGQQRRLVWAQVLFSVLLFLLVARLAWSQLYDRLGAESRDPDVIPAVRGSIVDVNGQYLAASTYACNVFFRPDRYDQPKYQKVLRERMAVTSTVLAYGLALDEESWPDGYTEDLARALIDPATGAPRELAKALADGLADRESLMLALVEEMQGESEERAERLKEVALASGGDMDSYLPSFLSVVLNEPQSEMERLIAASRDSRHTVSVGVNETACDAVRAAAGDTDILVVEYAFQRVYPDGTLASHLLGFVNFQGEPQYGLEWYYDEPLRGANGTWQGVNHPSGSRLLATLGGYMPAHDGSDLVLTLDRNIQFKAEQVLWQTLATSGATSGNILVLDSATGALLAMANNPTYDPGRFWEVGLETLRNSATSAVYEPGSVIKPLTIAAALDARVIYRDDTYDDTGTVVVGDQEIHNWDLQAHGETSMTELLAYSYNVGAATVANALGSARFYEMFKRFGFSDLTGIDLSAEERGIMRVPGQDDWSMSDLGRNSYGQGMSATPLQVAVAYGALANGGVMRRPHVVAAVRGAEGTRATAHTWGRQVVSAQVAQEVTDMLVEAVPMGMEPALVPGYTIAGKSGTSQVAIGGQYQENNYIGSFVGYGPIPDPRFVVLVKLDGLKDGQWGGQVAGPAFAQVFKYLMDYYGIRPAH